MHVRRGKPSEYGIRLREKQKLKRFYGIFKRQFRRYFELASRSPENTGEQLLTIMERPARQCRASSRFARDRAAARQLVAHGHVNVNGRSCNIPSMLLRANDIVQIKNRPRGIQLVKLALQDNPPPPPDYLERIDGEVPEGKLLRLPTRGDVDPRIHQRHQGATHHRILLAVKQCRFRGSALASPAEH